MRTFHELPEHVLYDTISLVVDFTQSKGWQLSLRLVNRKYDGNLRLALTNTTSLM